MTALGHPLGKTAADAIGLRHPVRKANAVRNSEDWLAEMRPPLAKDADGSLSVLFDDDLQPKATFYRPISARLDNMQKYVASTTLSEPLAWINSTLLRRDAAEAVTRLKQERGRDLAVMGSGVLPQSLMRANLVDEYPLLIHSLVLGSGRRLFPGGGASAARRLLDSKTTTDGIMIATYRRPDLHCGRPPGKARGECAAGAARAGARLREQFDEPHSPP